MNKAKKTFFGMLAGLILTLAGSTYGYIEVGKKLEQRSLEVSELRADQKIIQDQIGIYQETQRKIEELSFVNDLTAQVLPSTKNDAEARAELQRYATASNMPISQFSQDGGESAAEGAISGTKEVEGLTGVRVYSLQLTFQTSDNHPTYNEFLQFLEKVENNRRKMQITNLTISPQPDNSDVIASISMNINVYVKG